MFTSWGKETVKKFSAEAMTSILKALENSEKYGFILRAKGIVESDNGQWIYFDYIPEEINVRTGASSTIGKICVIGSNINEAEICALFGVN